MPSSPPGPPPPPTSNDTPDNKSSSASDTAKTMGVFAIIGTVIGVIFAFIWHFGAASLSYAKYGSIGWAILDFFFATIYYPYYALFLNTPAASPIMFGGRRRMKLW